MGVYFGTVYVAVLAEPENSFVLHADKQPAPLGRSVYVPLKEKYRGYEQFDDIKAAKLAVKSHILQKTEQTIISMTVSRELSLLKAQSLRMLSDKNDIDIKQQIEREKEMAQDEANNIKALKKLRSQAVEVRYD